MKFFTLAFLLSMLCTTAWSQTDSSFLSLSPLNLSLKNEPRFYLTLHTGYDVALGSTFKFYPDDITSIVVNMPAGGTPSKQVTSKATNKGLGEGFRYGAGISYIVNDFINVGIDFDYVNSSISRTKDSAMQSTEPMPGGATATNNFKEQYTISYNTRLLTIAPNITFKAISRPKFFIYNKIGAIVTFHPNSIQRETQQDRWSANWQGFLKDSSSTTGRRYEWGIKNPAFGFMGAVGAQVKLLERVRAFAELQFTHVLFVVENRVLTNYSVNGKEMVNTLPVNMREVDFRSTVTNDVANPDPNKPAMTVTQRFPLTYVGLQVGLAYRF
jgi:hypothetical protein